MVVDMCLAAESSIHQHLMGHFAHFGCEAAESIFHSIDCVLEAKSLAFDLFYTSIYILLPRLIH